MNSMTVSQTGGEHGRQPSITKQTSLYASRMKAPPPPLTSLAAANDGRHRPPQLSPMPVSPRWDSLSNGSNMLLRSPVSPLPPQSPSQNSWYERYGQLDEAASPQHQPQQQPPAASPYRPFPASTGKRRPPEPLQLDSASALMTKSMRTEVQRFTFFHALLAAPPTSFRLLKIFTLLCCLSIFPPTAEYLESRASRSASAQPPIAGHRPQLGYHNRIDSPAFAPTPGGPAPWMSDDELRSSYRSQLTSSSAFGTAITERSSVLTKDSSVLSLYGNENENEAEAQAEADDADEPSLEDVMGMYERGFCDDDDDQFPENEYPDPYNNNYNEEHHQHPYDHHHYPYDDQYNVGYGAAPYDDSYPRIPESELELEQEPELEQEQERQQERQQDQDQEHKQEHGRSLEHGRAPLPTHDEEVEEEESAEDDTVPDNMISVMHRPVTARSEPGPERTHNDDFDADPVPPVPATHSALDMEIRQSKMLFSSAAFTSTVPALTHDHDLDHDPEHDLEFPEKRDSSRTVESAPSVDSDVHLPAPEPEKPGARDRYGFKKENQFITRQQYDAWDKTYSQYLARRRKKWTSYLKDSALMTDRPQRFPAPNAKTKRFVRKGIPPDWRGAAWFYYAGGPAILAKHGGLYDKLLLRQAKHVDIEAIERDLHRTFPDNIQFKPSQATADMLDTTTSSERASQSTVRGAALDGSGPGPVGLEGEPPLIASLRRVLLAFAVYNPRIGYCQSLNFIAGLLLLFVDTEEQAFWLLNVITHIYLPGTHEMSLEGSKVDLGVLMTELRDTMPAVWDKIGGELDSGEPLSRPMTSKSVRNPLNPLTPRLKRKEAHAALSSERLPPITLCMTAWFMSCYIGTLPIETTLRVWDVFFYEGSKTLFRVALAIFKLGENEIKAIGDPMEMFGVVQSLPRKMLDANKVLETCFKRRNGFNHLSQEVIEERRQERRDKAQQDLLLRSRSKAATTGATGREADGERKGGSLFGLKK
ncbi:hypothetical protein TrVFT333_008040 [Trichoderma virens FT-333]|nr:hypothetical protein TrVFT333_008040 [Trichoderma virens FT-333]